MTSRAKRAGATPPAQSEGARSAARTQPKRGNGQGSIEELPNGKYRWKLTLGIDARGKQRRVSKVAVNKSAAARALASAIADRDRGLLVTPDRVTLGEWLAHWLQQRQSQVGVTTHDMYDRYLKLYVPSSLRQLRLQEIRSSHLRALDADLTRRKLSAATRSKTFSLLRSAFEMALEDGHLVSNPARNVRVHAPAEERQRRKRKAFTPDELRRFMTAAEGHKLYALIYTMFSLGLRRGEALGLRWQDIDFEQGAVRIVQQVKPLGNGAIIGALKTRSSRRTLHPSQDLLDVLQIHQARQYALRTMLDAAWADTDLVFTSEVGTMLDPHNVNRAIAQICKRAGLPRFGSHTGRHTHITHRLMSGEQPEVVAAIAGHGTSRTTTSSYREVFQDEMRQAVYSLRQHLVEKESDQ